ncbi:MAG: hypothetical protein RLZZ187_3760 [Pseudomonadota bacterium]
MTAPQYSSSHPDIVSAVELLLAATFPTRQDGWGSQFLFGRWPGAPMWERNVGAAVFYTRVGLLEAALHVRSVGPNFLRSLSMQELQSNLTDFLAEHYSLIADEAWLRRDNVPYAQFLSPRAKASLATALAQSAIFKPDDQTALFPLVPVRVAADFKADPFFLIEPRSLGPDVLQAEPPWGDGLHSDRFPPWPDWVGRTWQPGAWLGTHSPTISRALRMRSAVLGALALLPHPRQRYLFSGREMFGGWAVAGVSWISSISTEGHTPPLMHNLVVDAEDHAWLALLADKLESPANEARKHINALEYFYRAWPLPEVERFPVLFMALDAIFGDASRATAAIVDAVSPLVGPSYDATRLRRLLGLRAAVIHGGAPEVYDSRSYAAYFREFMEDPVRDLEAITARCLSQVIFGRAQRTKPEPQHLPP